ncbi:MAG: hypothetical protein RJQ04_16835 [Longimicrobiales bacterium]
MPKPPAARQRLRFDDLTHDVQPDGRCRMSVRLEWRGRTLEAHVEGLETHQGRLRACAQAALEAAARATEGDVRFDLVGVKAVRAFDGWVVVSRVNAEDPSRNYRLLGSAACEDEEALGRCTVQAVLDATNRVLERHA